jgi:hypothetical protein
MPIWILSSYHNKNHINVSVIRFALNATTTSRESRQVNPWTQSNFNHKKYISHAFTHYFIFSTILFQKYKNIFTFLHTQPKPQNTITASYLLYCIVIYFIAFIIIFFLLTFTPCDWQPLGGVGDTRRGDRFAGCLKKNERSFFDCSLSVNPEFPCGENLLLLLHCTWSPNE